MIQLNLLPDIKQEFIKVRRIKRLVMSFSVLLAAISFVIFVVLILIVMVAQKNDIRNIDKDIVKQSAELKGTPNLDQILTVQNQLNSLPALNSQKPATSRLFGYVKQVTPNNVNITSLDIDYTLHTVTFTGTADSADTINVFVDTLKFTTYDIVASDSSKSSGKAFSSVVLTSFDRTKTQATYTITFAFDPLIFDNTNTTTLVVPNIISTRSEVDKPKALFQGN